MRVMSWRKLGNSWETSVANSGVLAESQLPAAPRSPSEAAQEKEHGRRCEELIAREIRGLLPDEVSRRYETAHHESAHAVVVMALNKTVGSIRINTDDPSGGLCTFERGASPLEIATVCVAPIVWIEQVYYKEFRHYLPWGATGCESDLRRARDAAGWELDRAFRECREILRENYDSVVAVAEKLDRDGEFRPYPAMTPTRTGPAK